MRGERRSLTWAPRGLNLCFTSDLETAIGYWGLLLPGKFVLLEKWNTYLTVSHVNTNALLHLP